MTHLTTKFEVSGPILFRFQQDYVRSLVSLVHISVHLLGVVETVNQKKKVTHHMMQYLKKSVEEIVS